jgi:hypothetical protein
MQLADAGTPINGFTGGTAFTSCIGYTLNNAPVVADQVNTTFVSATNAGITLSGTNVLVVRSTRLLETTLWYTKSVKY